MIFALPLLAMDSLAMPDTLRKTSRYNAISTIGRGSIEIYQKLITDLDAQECPMNPSCSEFASRVFHKTNPIKALFLTADRLMRDNHFAQRYYRKDKNGKLIDDVERYIRCAQKKR